MWKERDLGTAVENVKYSNHYGNRYGHFSKKNLKDPPYDLIPLPSSQKTLSQHLILMVVYQYVLQYVHNNYAMELTKVSTNKYVDKENMV